MYQTILSLVNFLIYVTQHTHCNMVKFCEYARLRVISQKRGNCFVIESPFEGDFLFENRASSRSSVTLRERVSV